MSAQGGGGSLQSQIQAALMGQYPGASQTSVPGQMTPDMQSSLQGNQAMVQQLGQDQAYPQYGMPQAAGGAGGAQPGYMDLMRSLMMNPAAFTGGLGGTSPFAQALAANPQGLTNWQPTAPPQQAAANPIQAYFAQQQAAQAAAPAAAAAVPPPPDTSVSGSGSE